MDIYLHHLNYTLDVLFLLVLIHLKFISDFFVILLIISLRNLRGEVISLFTKCIQANQVSTQLIFAFKTYHSQKLTSLVLLKKRLIQKYFILIGFI